MVDLTHQDRSSPAQPGMQAKPPAEIPDSYWPFLKISAGTLFILLSAAVAGIMQALPLSSALTLSAGLAAGTALFLIGSLLQLSQMPGGKSLLSGGIVFLFVFLTGLLFSRGSVLLGTAAARSFFNFLLCLLVLILFGSIAWRIRSHSIGTVTALSALYLLHAALPLPDGRACLAVPVLLTCFFAFSLYFWLQDRQGHLLALLILSAASLLWIYAVKAGALSSPTGITAALTCTYILCQGLILYPCRNRKISAAEALRLCTVNAAAFAFSSGMLLFSPAAPLRIWMSALVLVAAAPLSFLLVQNHPLRLRFRALFGGQILIALGAALLLSWHAETRLILLTALCAGPAFAAWRYPHRSFRILEHLMIAGALILSFFLKNNTSPVMLGPVQLSSLQATLLAASMLFIFFSRLHSTWAYKAETGSLQKEAQQLLSLAHGLAAAFILAFHTILRREDSATLPWILLWQGCFFFGMSLVLSLPALTKGAMVSLLMSHSCYYALPLIYGPVLTPAAVLPGHQASLLLLFTLIAAIAGDTAGRRIYDGAPALPEKIAAALPYGAALFLAGKLLLFKAVFPDYLLFISLSAWIFFLLSENRYHLLPGMKATACLLLTVAFFLCLYRFIAEWKTLYYRPETLPALVMFLFHGLALEYLLGRRLKTLPFLQNLVRCTIPLLLFVVAAAVLRQWYPMLWYAAALLWLAVFFFTVAQAIHARRYSFCAAAALACLIVGLTVSGLAHLLNSTPL
ncbi:MAG TPA: hypothetical protein PLY90_01440 [Candidatus Hydrogenedentes bacterium]|nr:hypothetical protein [Candidatus Hydrogenedentota bacterium]